MDGLAARHGLANNTCASFIEYLLYSTGQAMSFWSKSGADPQFKVSESAADTMGILSSQVKLLRAMASGRKEWNDSINGVVTKILHNAPSLLRSLEGKIAEEMQLKAVISTTEDSFPLSLLFGLFAFVGYDAAGIYAGAAVVFTDPESGIEEEGVVVGISRPVEVKESKSKDKDKEQQQKLAKMWDSISSSHGEAVCVSLFSQPQAPTVLPRKLLRPSLPCSLPAKFKDFLANFIG